MNRTWIQIYAAAVCFGSVICIAVAGGTFLYAVVRVSAPAMTVSPYQAMTFNAVMVQPSSPGGVQVQSPSGNRHVVPVPAISAAESQERTIGYERQVGLSQAISSAIAVLVAAVLWFSHWRILKNSRNAAV